MKQHSLLIFLIVLAPMFVKGQCPPPNGSTRYQIVCPGSLTVQAISTGSNANVVHRWYFSASDFTYFLSTAGTFNGYTTTTSYTSTITQNTTFYVEAYNFVTNCVSARVPITVTVGPSITASGNTSTMCTNSPDVVLTASAGATYQWYNFNNPIAGATAQTYRPKSVGAYTVTVGGLACGQKTSGLYLLPIGKPEVTTTGALSKCGAATLELGASSQAMGGALTEHRWYTSATGSETVPCEVVSVGSGAFQSRVVRSFTQTTKFYVAAVNSNCGEGARVEVTATIIPPPEITVPTIHFAGDPNRVFASDDLPLTAAAAGFTTYQWYKDGIPVSGAQSLTLIPFASGRYTIAGTYMCGSVVSEPIDITWYNESQGNINYIETYTVLHGKLKEEGIVAGSPSSSVQKQTTYFDGLGRPLQEVIRRGSPAGKDVVQPHAYDQYGREPRKYLRYTGGVSGFYKPGAVANYTTSEQYNFYQQSSGETPIDTRPYSTTIFEDSPLQRPVQLTEAGEEWYDDGRSKQYTYLVHVDGAGAGTGKEHIIAWTINPAGMPVRRPVLSGYILAGGYYNTGQLQVKVAVDEDGNTVREYIDKAGKTVLKKVQVAAGNGDLNSRDQWALTYYVYNALGDLCFVFQPELSRIVHQNDVYNPVATDVTNFAFQYRYDGRRRSVAKRYPGVDWMYTVYDSRDRVVLTQNANQRSGAIQYWSFTKYDAQNRPVMTGIKDTSVVLTQAAMQDVVTKFYQTKSWARLYEQYVGTNDALHGYTNRSYPVVTTGSAVDANRYLTVSYYDSYDFLEHWPVDYGYKNDELSDDVSGVQYDQNIAPLETVIGKVTGGKAKVLDGGVAGGYTWLKTVNRYDANYRVIQVVADNYKGGIDRSSTLYDFTGKILKTKSVHQQADVSLWKDNENVSVRGNKLTRTLPGVVWGASGIASVESLKANTNGWMAFTATEENSSRIIGLSSQNRDANYPSIEYAIYLRNDQTSYILEKGVNLGTVPGGYKTGDVFRIQREGTSIKYFRNGTDITPANSALQTSPVDMYIDIAFGTYLGTVANIRSSFTSGIQSVDKHYVYDQAGHPVREFHSLNGANPIETVRNEYNELGLLIDKKLHGISASEFQQSIDYRYNIRGWKTNINNSQLDDGEDDYFGMDIAYQDEIGTSNRDGIVDRGSLVGQYAFDGDLSDNSPAALPATQHGGVFIADAGGNNGHAYSFENAADYLEIPNSKNKHSFIQNTGKFTISTFIRLSDLSARSVIIANTTTSVYKGFFFMYETYGAGYGNHQLRISLTKGQSGVSYTALGGEFTINDTDWHHVAVVGDGQFIRFYVDGRPDGRPSPITLTSTGDATYTTFIGKSRTTGGEGILNMNGALDDLLIFNRALSQQEIRSLTRRVNPGTAYRDGHYNGTVSSVKWSVAQGLGDVKQMAYNFSYDPMGRLIHAENKQMTGSMLWETGSYHEKDFTYDLNGNIKGLMRYGDNGALQDNLVYSYGAGATFSNRLLKVTDQADKWLGFKDGANGATDDYTYDGNGNMLTDQNKGITTGITYNYMNLPELVTKGANTVQFIYDATGKKLAQVATFNSVTKQTDYCGEFQYENDMLKFLNHGEGRVVLSKEQRIISFDGSSLDPVTAIDATVTTENLNGNQTYVKAVATSGIERSGLFPIGGTFSVQPGERYRIRVKAYRETGSAGTTNAAYILVKSNNAYLGWPGAAIQSSATTEAWTEQVVTIPAGVSQLEAGVTWGTVSPGNIIYLNEFQVDKLESTDPEYQYFIKDHLNNVRVMFTSKEQSENSIATLETKDRANESANFVNYNQAVTVNSNVFDHTHNHEPDSLNPSIDARGYAMLLRGSNRERYGIAKTLSVMPGDKINMQVYAKYVDSKSKEVSPALASLITSLVSGVALPQNGAVDGVGTASSRLTGMPFEGLVNRKDDTGTGPKAYLNWLIFDRNYTIKNSGFSRMSNAPAESGKNVPHERLAGEINITEPGYVYVYVSNENETPVDVFFDDFRVNLVKAAIIQEQDYYPFGLTFNSYARENSVGNAFKFQSQEHVDDLDIGWDAFKWRNHQPEIGRFFNVDPLAEKYEYNSLYAFSENHVTGHVELEGLEKFGVNSAFRKALESENVAKYSEAAYESGKDIIEVNVGVQAWGSGMETKFGPYTFGSTIKVASLSASMNTVGDTHFKGSAASGKIGFTDPDDNGFEAKGSVFALKLDREDGQVSGDFKAASFETKLNAGNGPSSDGTSRAPKDITFTKTIKADDGTSKQTFSATRKADNDMVLGTTLTLGNVTMGGNFNLTSLKEYVQDMTATVGAFLGAYFDSFINPENYFLPDEMRREREMQQERGPGLNELR